MTDDRDQSLQPNVSSDENFSIQDEGSWSLFVDSNNYQSKGFLQMCIERRFHRAIQERFEEEMKEIPLGHTDYWIHTDAGGSPKMEDESHLLAPKYCYDQGATVMGWSAHGSKCGGFPNKSDEFIFRELKRTLAVKHYAYPNARHVGLFAIETPKGIEICFLG